MYIDAVATPSDASRLNASSVHFKPGARTAWHTHPNGQTIYVTDGVGLAQRRGGPIAVIRRGDRVFFEPGEDHWPGAAPDRFMTHLAMRGVDDDTNPVTWGDYLQRRAPGRGEQLGKPARGVGLRRSQSSHGESAHRRRRVGAA